MLSWPSRACRAGAAVGRGLRIVQMLRDVALVALGGSVGAGLRYSVGVWLSQRLSRGFPWHTFTVNVFGAFLLGLLMSVSVEHSGWGRWQLFAGVGLLGGFTTFSTFSYETLRLLEDGATAAAAGNALGSVAAGLLAAAAGLAVGRAI